MYLTVFIYKYLTVSTCFHSVSYLGTCFFTYSIVTIFRCAITLSLQHFYSILMHAVVQFFKNRSLLEYNCFTILCFCCTTKQISHMHTHVPISPVS